MKNSTDISQELRARTVGYIAAAFGLVAGLAWNDAIKALIEYIFPLSVNTLWAKLVYALLVTAIAVIITASLLRFLNRQGKAEE